LTPKIKLTTFVNERGTISPQRFEGQLTTYVKKVSGWFEHLYDGNITKTLLLFKKKSLQENTTLATYHNAVQHITSSAVFLKQNLLLVSRPNVSVHMYWMFGCLWLGSHACCLCYDYIFLPTSFLKRSKVPQPYAKCSVTKKLDSLKLHSKKFCHTKTASVKAILVTYINSAWKNT